MLYVWPYEGKIGGMVVPNRNQERRGESKDSFLHGFIKEHNYKSIGHAMSSVLQANRIPVFLLGLRKEHNHKSIGHVAVFTG